jgi:hypothetical protein
MNILIDALPATVEVDGIPYKVNTDFRVGLRVMVASEDDELTQDEKAAVLIKLLYVKTPPNLEQALIAGLTFLNGPIPPNDLESGPRTYSLTKDATLIFSAFRQTHSIDLTTADLHWWEFLALFMDLGADTAFCSLVNLRRRLATGRASKEERDMAREMGDLVEVPTPDTRSVEEREAELAFMTALGGD